MAAKDDRRLPHVDDLPPNLVLMVIGKALAQAYGTQETRPLPPKLHRIVREIERRERSPRDVR
jgi:hypothetical protein